MIRTHGKIRIPSHLYGIVRDMTDGRFVQKDIPIQPGIAKLIPYPECRQEHCLIALGYGGVEQHTDNLYMHQETGYCVPFHFPKGARLWQEDQHVILERGSLYSFNYNRPHGVASPDNCRTYCAFLTVSIVRKEWLKK